MPACPLTVELRVTYSEADIATPRLCVQTYLVSRFCKLLLLSWRFVSLLCYIPSRRADKSRVSSDVEPLPTLDFSVYAQGNPTSALNVDPIDDDIRPQPLPRPHNNLPFSESNWSRVVKAFMIPKAIIHPTRRNKCQSTFVTCNHEGADLELHTAVAAPYNQLGSFSLSCTYFNAPKLTLAVFYSCNSTQLRRITQLLRGSPEVASHPLLMVGVFAELQLNRMEEVVSRVHTYCDFNTRVFALNWDPNRATLIKNLSLRLRDGIIKSREAEEEMRTVRAQLKEIADRIADQERAWTAWAPPAGAEGPAGPNTPAILNRFKGRFKEIDNEIDGLMSQCRTTAEAQQYTSDLVSAAYLPTPGFMTR